MSGLQSAKQAKDEWDKMVVYYRGELLHPEFEDNLYVRFPKWVFSLLYRQMVTYSSNKYIKYLKDFHHEE